MKTFKVFFLIRKSNGVYLMLPSKEDIKSMEDYFTKHHDRIYLQAQEDLFMNLIELSNKHKLNCIPISTIREFQIALEKKYKGRY